jgi:hypothetical protein
VVAFETFYVGATTPPSSLGSGDRDGSCASAKRKADKQTSLFMSIKQALTSDMIYSQPVVYEFDRIRVPVLLMIRGTDRTAPGANRAAPELARRLPSSDAALRARSPALR